MPEIPGPSTLGSLTAVDELASFRSEIEALGEKDLVTPRVDVSAAALTAIGAMREIGAHRALLVGAFGERAVLALDRLPAVARTLLLAHARFVAVAERDLEPMARELMDVRTTLVTSATAIVERGVVDKKSLDILIGGQSYQARMADTLALVAWFHVNASLVAPYTKVSPAELAHAQELAIAFGQAVSERDLARAGTGPQAHDRVRVFTLFFRSYEHVRKLVGFVRWHERDADRIAPSIFAGRTTRKSGDVAAPKPDPTNFVPPGMPGADPFTA